jgi:hypothetical protein
LRSVFPEPTAFKPGDVYARAACRFDGRRDHHRVFTSEQSGFAARPAAAETSLMAIFSAARVE